MALRIRHMDIQKTSFDLGGGVGRKINVWVDLWQADWFTNELCRGQEGR